MDARDAILRAVLQINAAELGEEDVPTDSPLALFFERASRDSLRKSLPGVDDVSWNEPLTKAAEEKPWSNPLNFSRGSVGFLRKIDRLETVTTADGTKWQHAFSGTELIDARQIDESEE